MYTVYVLFSKKLNRYYLGYTAKEVDVRLAEHLSNHKGFTSKSKDWTIVYSESYDTKKEAMMRETQLKGWRSSVRIKEMVARSSSG